MEVQRRRKRSLSSLLCTLRHLRCPRDVKLWDESSSDDDSSEDEAPAAKVATPKAASPAKKAAPTKMEVDESSDDAYSVLSKPRSFHYEYLLQTRIRKANLAIY